MTNTDVLRRVRYLYNLSESEIIALFDLAEHEVSKAEIDLWLKKENDPDLVEITDRELALFLNGLIIDKRGKREGPQPEPEDPLSNNMILKKLKIATNMKADEMLELFALKGKRLSKHELSAFFRNPNHPSYRPLMDQYLRSFLSGLHAKYKKNLGKRPSQG